MVANYKKVNINMDKKNLIILFLSIVVVILIVFLILEMTIKTSVEEVTSVENKICSVDGDCVVFGESGYCNAGCYNKDNIPTELGEKCFLQAPTSCRCINKVCEPIWE